MPPNQTPLTNLVLDMINQGKDTQQISQELQSQGYTLQQINEAINMANIKSGVESNPAGSAAPSEQMQVSSLNQDEDIPVPTPSSAPQPAPVQQPTSTVVQQPQQSQVIPQQSFSAVPQMPTMSAPQMNLNYDDIQALVEEVIDEKWKEFVSSLGDLTVWKAQVGDELESVKQEILRVQSRFDNLQAAVLGKVDEYNSSVINMGSELKALEKVLEKIMEPLVSNIKELSRITESLKKGK